MPDIKTKKENKGTIKTLDKAKIASGRMKSAYIQTKDKAEHSVEAEEYSANEYATDRMESGAKRGAEETARQTKKQLGNAKDEAKMVKNKVKQRIKNKAQNKAENAVKDSVQKSSKNAAKKSAEKSVRTTSSKAFNGGRKSIHTVEQTSKTVKQSARSAGRKTVKTTQKGTAKTVKTSVKTAEKTSKAAIKTSKQAAKATQKTAQATAKAAQRAAQAARAAAKAVVQAAKVAVKATIATIKAIIAGIKALASAIAAGGWVAVVIIIVICLIALIVCSCFGIFASGEDSGTGVTMHTAVQEINEEYNQKIEDIKSNNTYDILEMSGSRADWKEVIAIYAVDKNMADLNPDVAQEVATMDEGKKEDLRKLFWEMNKVESHIEKKTVKETVEVKENGKTVKKEKDVEKTTLYITISHIDLETMMNNKSFTDEQKEMCRELLSDENNSLWLSVLHGISGSDSDIVKVAQEQLGNAGGQPYWSWYGFSSRVEWCACFVPWCANECGYIENNLIPKYSVCDTGVNWFKSKGEWLDGAEEAHAGMIIFFDWESDGLDGNSDHTGIVEKVESGRVYTIEGNSGDACQEKFEEQKMLVR